MENAGFFDNLTGKSNREAEQANNQLNQAIHDFEGALDGNDQITDDLRGALRRHLQTSHNAKKALASTAEAAGDISERYGQYANNARTVRNGAIAAGL